MTLKQLTVALVIFLSAACNSETGATTATGLSTDGTNEQSLELVNVRFETTLGNFTVELNADRAPATVANFLQYIDDGFYNGTIFHRVIPGFMVQGGGFTADMQQKQTRDPIQNEADNGLPNRVGSIAMARTGDPHSATAQFFINVKDNTFLNHRGKNPAAWGYTVFGKVTDGMDTINAIELVVTGNRGRHQNVPVEPVIIERVARVAE